MPTIPEPCLYSGPASVYREDEAIVFVGGGDWQHTVALEQVATDDGLAQVTRMLRAQPWMDDDLFAQFLAEVQWLRLQLPPGK